MKPANIILFVALLVFLAAAGAGFMLYQYAVTPTSATNTTIVVWIKPGQGFSETVTQLQKVGLVRHPTKFRWLVRLRGDDRRIQAGEYVLQTSMSPWTILDTLVRGEILLHKVVIPEGATLVQIARILETAGLVSRDAFLRAACDRGLVKALGLEGNTFEGYLFPETYYFPKGVTPKQVIRKMVAHFRSVFTPAWTKRARAIGLTTHQVVTLASIVEKETAKPEERPLISAVFLNRLKRRMRLESDPTVIYGIKDFDGNLTRKDLQTVTPYNTYQIMGLPPGPIANPGRASIEAVLYPSDQPYLYFVSRNDGSHHFSRTLREHNRMVRRYQHRRP
ncbi:MAG: endolytic transglycosylase MltG [Deltaproteobacteria bacterium]|mgnify:CR=1 FL=1|nr:endolytic transglycosylase MltG [Deltaproteobacteria bacterium]MBW2018554.1 endolytic transglycosylase MltG [Deltaproteobacteria bacterium]MBW2073289.1 endolytic transglycosylase MltG [Deltaproteobacteria bacterium]RLB83341.1 MAG: endolytic transglycosylase MltG [Deltaproteobacteria bacterium]